MKMCINTDYLLRFIKFLKWTSPHISRFLWKKIMRVSTRWPKVKNILTEKKSGGGRRKNLEFRGGRSKNLDYLYFKTNLQRKSSIYRYIDSKSSPSPLIFGCWIRGREGGTFTGYRKSQNCEKWTYLKFLPFFRVIRSQVLKVSA